MQKEEQFVGAIVAGATNLASGIVKGVQSKKQDARDSAARAEEAFYKQLESKRNAANKKPKDNTMIIAIVLAVVALLVLFFFFSFSSQRSS